MCIRDRIHRRWPVLIFQNCRTQKLLSLLYITDEKFRLVLGDILSFPLLFGVLKFFTSVLAFFSCNLLRISLFFSGARRSWLRDRRLSSSESTMQLWLRSCFGHHLAVWVLSWFFACLWMQVLGTNYTLPSTVCFFGFTQFHFVILKQKSTVATVPASKLRLCSIYFRIHNETGGFQRNTLSTHMHSLLENVLMGTKGLDK